MGLGLAEPDFHTRAYVEWEEYPRSVIIAAQQAGYLEPAPIWDDLTTFDARPLAGAIDTLLAGYPCQPFSAAGQRRGESDERHLWPEVARVARELGEGLQWILLENVAGHVSLGAETVLRELRDMGFTPAAGLFSAEETGATHERLRWFCVARRVENAVGAGAWGRTSPSGERGRDTLVRRGAGIRRGDGSACSDGTAAACQSDRRYVGDAQGVRRGEGRAEPVVWGGRDTSTISGRELADTECSAGHERRTSISRSRTGTRGEGAPVGARRPLHSICPPGPSDQHGWTAVLAVASHLAPSVAFGDVARRAGELAEMVEAGELAETEAESALRGMVDGLATRTRSLKLLGNGVHPLAAGYAWRSLSAAHGLSPLDLAATGDGSAAGTDGSVLRVCE